MSRSETKHTRFEKAKIIGMRAVQLDNGAEPRVDIGNLDNSYDIAIREYEEEEIPFILVRKYPRRKEEVKIVNSLASTEE